MGATTMDAVWQAIRAHRDEDVERDRAMIQEAMAKGADRDTAARGLADRFGMATVVQALAPLDS